ncbi:MAG: pilus assembly protein [Magnetococcales bacterium]|nr:pilus assembly protein [Magnetococcales bacterium]
MIHQNGSVLIITLILLSVLTLLGVTATKNTSLEEGMVSNTRDRQLAFQAAEAALLAGERMVENAHPTFDGSCTNGYCTQGCPTTPRWTDTSLNVWSNAARHQTYTVQLQGVLSTPKFIIEDLCEYGSQTWRSANPGWTDLPQRMYRITAQGTGGTDNARVMLQTTYAVTRAVNPACATCDTTSLAGTTTTSTTTTSTTSIPTTTTTSIPTTTTTSSTTSIHTTTSTSTSTSTTTTSVPAGSTTTTSTSTSTTTTSTPVSTTTSSVYNCQCKKNSGVGKRATTSQPACCTNAVCDANRPANFSSMANNATYWITCY